MEVSGILIQLIKRLRWRWCYDYKIVWFWEERYNLCISVLIFAKLAQE